VLAQQAVKGRWITGDNAHRANLPGQNWRSHTLGQHGS
jgi:hypothetical protein